MLRYLLILSSCSKTTASPATGQSAQTSVQMIQADQTALNSDYAAYQAALAQCNSATDAVVKQTQCQIAAAYRSAAATEAANIGALVTATPVPSVTTVASTTTTTTTGTTGTATTTTNADGSTTTTSGSSASLTLGASP